jgi:serine/threonine protein kinase
MTSKARTDPTIVGNYEIIRKLGKGAYGTVKLGVHIKTGEKVAIKIIKSKHIKTLKEREMVEREKKILLNLNHPHVVKLKEVIESTNKRTSYMVFEYIPGGELFRHLVSNGPMQEHEARRLFRQLVSGLEYLHANLIIHRDIKPENILLDENGNAKISDFGLANTIRPGRKFETFCGSLHYAAPEILNGVPYVGPPIDVWALGIVLYCMVPSIRKSLVSHNTLSTHSKISRDCYLTILANRLSVVSLGTLQIPRQ